jgi:hypothetical protein
MNPCLRYDKSETQREKQSAGKKLCSCRRRRKTTRRSIPSRSKPPNDFSPFVLFVISL